MAGGNKEAPVLLSIPELHKLRDDTDSCVKVKTCIHHIILHPFHLSNVGNSIKEILNAGIAQYHHEFEGILLGYENIKLFGYKAPMYDDKCYLHKKIEADFYIFNPTVGSILTGVINKKSDDHIGCLVHKLFNISLPKPTNERNWLGTNAVLGQGVQFKVTFMNLDARLPYIKGELLALVSEDSGISTSDEVTEINAKSSKKLTKKVKKEESEDENALEDWNQFESIREKLKKKKKQDEATQDTEESASPKKKKSKKGKITKEQKNTSTDKVLQELEQKYQDNLSNLKDMAQSESLKVKKKKKKDMTNIVKEEFSQEDTMGDKDKKKHKKAKKEKKNKDKNSNKERDWLDDTLPDLNLDALFADGTINGLNNTNSEPIQCDNIILPNDSEMDEVLKDIPIKSKKSKKSSKKRKLDEEVDNELMSKKKKRKST